MPLPTLESTRKRQRGPSTSSTTKSVKVSQLATKKWVKTCMLRVADVKHVISQDSLVPGSAGTVGASLCDMGQGTGEQARIGAQINITKIDWQLRATLPAASTGDSIRVVVVLDKQPSNLGNPAITDVFESASAAGLYNQSNATRFTILKDFTFALNPTSAVVASGTANLFFHKQGTFKFRGMPVNYQGNTGTVNDIVTNNIVAMYFSQNASANVLFRSQVCFVNP